MVGPTILASQPAGLRITFGCWRWTCSHIPTHRHNSPNFLNKDLRTLSLCRYHPLSHPLPLLFAFSSNCCQSPHLPTHQQSPSRLPSSPPSPPIAIRACSPPPATSSRGSTPQTHHHHLSHPTSFKYNLIPHHLALSSNCSPHARPLLPCRYGSHLPPSSQPPVVVHPKPTTTTS